jgi:hypothetical protein
VSLSPSVVLILVSSHRLDSSATCTLGEVIGRIALGGQCFRTGNRNIKIIKKEVAYSALLAVQFSSMVSWCLRQVKMLYIKANIHK